ncbi:MAG: endo-1,3-alpha-glucanase family glycosylhydrolase [Chloroflexi bacterium]|nr:endo-1,3-alpha-glucanase family glycosylhydrolase [Chloroflexota bacterium]
MSLGLLSVLWLFGILMWIFPAAIFAQIAPASLPVLPTISVNNLANPACAMPDQLVLAEYQVWHGLPSHKEPQPYISTDPSVIARHIQAAQAQCIGGFVVDWYGPPAGLPSDADRNFEDQATRELIRQSDSKNFKVALMYDEGTLRILPTTDNYTAQVISDLRYASQYFAMPSYLQLNQHPVVFIFPYEELDAHIDWRQVRQQLGITITLIEKDPNPSTVEHDALFDGFYSWVQASTPEWQIGDWGERYLRWFYTTMTTPAYANKLTIGGVWPGFNHNRASPEGRYMARRCGQTWLDTWALAHTYAPSLVMISTWNDFSEGTDIENGIIKSEAGNNSPTIAGEPTLLSATLSDCMDAAYTWDFGDGTLGSGADVTHTYAAAGLYTATVTAANSTTTLTATTMVQIKSNTVAWQENFEPFALAMWQQITAKWVDASDLSAELCEDNPNDISGKVESEKLTIDIDRYSMLYIGTQAIDPEARYTIQILDKTTGIATDLLSNITKPGLRNINLAKQLKWTGTQSFTINIWIIGEGKCAVFTPMSIEKSEIITEPFLPTKVFLPMIAR